MITRIKDKDNDLNWTVTPLYKIGEYVEYADNMDGGLVSEIVGIQVDINRLTEKAKYCLANGDRIVDKQIIATFKREEEKRRGDK